MSGAAMDALLAAAATAEPTPAPKVKPSFLSPEPAAMTARDHMQRTLSEGARKKMQKRKLMERSDVREGSATPTIVKRKKKLLIGDTPQSERTREDKIRGKENEGKAKSNNKMVTPAAVAGLEKPRKLKGDGSGGETATRRLEFTATPSKPEKKSKKEIQPASESSSSSSSDEDEDDDHSSASSDECEVTFDAMTLGNLRIIREAVPSPLSTASSVSSGSTKPIGLEYRFNVGSTVSSITVAPNGKFLVVGFYNGAIFLYPLTNDSLRFRHGVLLDQISARGMYTQLMVRVALPEDGKFIFAGVYRGSTEIRAFEVDSIELPSIERLAQSAVSRSSDRDESSDEESDNEDTHGHPSARSISHTYSDAKLKGFSDVKSVVRKSSNQTEYHLLCGLGIKNIHMWRFYRDEAAQQWSWECIFDKQSNGISIEMLCFHRDIEDQIISKSEHQNIRIWNLEEDAVTGEIKKKSHVDVKQTVDATAVYGDHAYGGGEALALIDLRSSTRVELDLPLSVKEQEAKEANSRVNVRTRITASLRGRRSGTRGRGSADDVNNGQRLMRMVNQVAGRDTAPFVVGMCTDGSVFMHHPQQETMGVATPLEYIEGYEEYFQDPSLSFQEKFSDLTRVNTSGLLAVLPLPKTEREDWMVVAANAQQLLVRSMDAFLHRNELKQDHGRVRRGLQKAMAEMGKDGSNSESDSDDESASDDDVKAKKENARAEATRDTYASKLGRGREDFQALKSRKLPKVKVDKSGKENKPRDAPNRMEIDNLRKDTKQSTDSTTKLLLPPSIPESTEPATGDFVKATESVFAVTTPVRKARPTGSTPRGLTVPSPVVSISSPSSASSNPNTPERVKGLSQAERRAIIVTELEWTPQPDATPLDQKAAPLLRETHEGATEGLDMSAATKRGRQAKRKPLKSRTKSAAQALFTNYEEMTSMDADSERVDVKRQKRPAEALLAERPTKKLVVTMEAAPLPASVSTTLGEDEDECTDAEDNESEPEVMFSLTPLMSDGNSMLAASMYQYAVGCSPSKEAAPSTFNAQEVDMMMRFSSQLERLKKSYLVDRERIMRHFTLSECDCSSAKKKPVASVSKLNWRKQIAGEASKKKHMKRRQKKQLAAKLKELHASYEGKLNDIRLIQRLELQAFTARQEFQLLAAQF